MYGDPDTQLVDLCEQIFRYDKHEVETFIYNNWKKYYQTHGTKVTSHFKRLKGVMKRLFLPDIPESKLRSLRLQAKHDVLCG